MTISILKAEPFYPLGKPIQRPAKEGDKPADVQVRPGIWRKPDGTLETRAYETPKPCTDERMCTGCYTGKTCETAPATPLPVVPNALGDGWIDIGAETPDLQAGCYEWRNKTALVAYKAQRLSIRDLFNENDCGTYQYRLIPTEAA